MSFKNVNIEYSSDSEDSNVPKKKQKVKYERKVPLKLLTAEKYSSWLQVSKFNSNKGYCKLCNCEVAGSSSQIKRHEETDKHKGNVKVDSKLVKVTDFMRSEPSDHQNKVASAELKLCGFIAEHNLPIALLDHLPGLISNVCSDSKLAKDIKCARTKGTSIFSNIIGPDALSGLVSKLKSTDCCKRWAYVRDYYIRRRGNPGSGSGEAAKKRSELLSFLDSNPSVKRSSISNVAGNELESNIKEETQDDYKETVDCIKEETLDDYEETLDSGTSTDEHASGYINADELREGKETKKLSQAEERLKILKKIDDSDELDLFFSSISKTVKRLPRYEQIKLKMEISSLVGNAELRSMQSSHYS